MKYLLSLIVVVTCMFFSSDSHAIKFGCSSGGYLTYHGIETQYRSYCSSGVVRGCHPVDGGYMYYNRTTTTCKKNDYHPLIEKTLATDNLNIVYYDGFLPLVEECTTIDGKPAYCTDDKKAYTEFEQFVFSQQANSYRWQEIGVYLRDTESNRGLCSSLDGYYHVNTSTCRWIL